MGLSIIPFDYPFFFLLVIYFLRGVSYIFSVFSLPSVSERAKRASSVSPVIFLSSS